MTTRTFARGCIVAIAFMASVAARPARLDPQAVLLGYATHMLAQKAPRYEVFTYTVSQAGLFDIEQTHRVYRSGLAVRDETLAMNGRALKPAERIIRIARYRNRYTLAALAPRLAEYAMAFQSARLTANHYGYAFRSIPLVRGQGYVVDSITIDGTNLLPSDIRFRLIGRTTAARGVARFARFGRYWMPVEVSVTAKLSGKAARERIAFSGYQFPASLPKSTFRAPKPLPTPALPTF